MKFIVGTKTGMTQVFDEKGVCHAATILKVEAQRVTQVKTVEHDGYAAVQIATGAEKAHRLNKAETGHLKTPAKVVREYRPKKGEVATVAFPETGATVTAATFTPGDVVEVTATSKGKGFQGVVKRHSFGGGRRTHGQKHSEREPGSIGATGFMRVIKGTRMAGRMGSDTITVKNLRVLQVVPEQNLLLVSGAVPGRNGALVEVRGLTK